MKKCIIFVSLISFTFVNGMKRPLPPVKRGFLKEANIEENNIEKDIPMEMLLPHGAGLIKIWKERNKRLGIVPYKPEEVTAGPVFKLAEGEYPVV